MDDDALAVPEVVPRGHEEGQRALTHCGPQPPRRRLRPVHGHVDVDVARPPGPREEWGLFSSEPHLTRDGRPVRDTRATPGSDTVDAAHRLSGVSAALLVLALRVIR